MQILSAITTKLRYVTIDDAELLLNWRNEPTSLAASRSPDHVISTEEHLAWLTSALANPDKQIYIAETDMPVGTIRAELREGFYELSWYVDLRARRQGVATDMLHQILNLTGRPLRAVIRVENVASRRLAERAGLHYVGAEDGWVIYGLG